MTGQGFEFVKRRHNWRADRVYVRDGESELVSLPAEWTDAVPEDPFVVVAGGHAPFHLDGLVALSELVESLTSVQGLARGRTPRGGRLTVKRITPSLSAGLCR